jgi:predicted nucleic acid-binding protein
MTAVFLDTVGLIALWDVADQWHSAAETAFLHLQAQRTPFITTTFVLLECGNTAARRPYRNQVSLLRRGMGARGELIVPTEEDWIAAWDAYDRGEAGLAGIVDHVSFAVMRRLGMTEAFTNDKHFQTAGFTPLF